MRITIFFHQWPGIYNIGKPYERTWPQFATLGEHMAPDMTAFKQHLYQHSQRDSYPSTLSSEADVVHHTIITQHLLEKVCRFSEHLAQKQYLRK